MLCDDTDGADGSSKEPHRNVQYAKSDCNKKEYRI
jgi:hypothetical protein